MAGGLATQDEKLRVSHIASSLLQGLWTSCGAVACQVLLGDGTKKERKQGKGRNIDKSENKRAGERWSVAVPEGEAWMTQTFRLL